MLASAVIAAEKPCNIGAKHSEGAGSSALGKDLGLSGSEVLQILVSAGAALVTSKAQLTLLAVWLTPEELL